MRSVVLVIYNVRSAHNVGSMLRTADGLGIGKVYLCGYTPYPISSDDNRLPHLAARTSRQIHKTALGAENSVIWHHRTDVKKTLEQLRAQDYRLIALEHTDKSIKLSALEPVGKIALVVGNEIAGLPGMVLDVCDRHVYIPMSGKKESFNVAVAAAIALYHLSHIT